MNAHSDGRSDRAASLLRVILIRIAIRSQVEICRLFGKVRGHRLSRRVGVSFHIVLGGGLFLLISELPRYFDLVSRRYR
jgi:hypothetical protein